MLTTNETNHLESILWECTKDLTQPNVYMVLDAARDKHIEPLLIKSQLKQSCLYSGELPYKLKRAAPHIVKLEHQNKSTRQLLAQAWGQSWGIFLIVDSSIAMSTVRTNCRKITKVATHDNRSLVFRYQDPRVLRKFLPIAYYNQLQMIFGASTAIAMESENGQNLIRYQLDKRASKLTSQRQIIITTQEQFQC